MSSKDSNLKGWRMGCGYKDGEAGDLKQTEEQFYLKIAPKGRKNREGP